ncbi:MAG TPA: DUF4386 domain-containing protein [Frateuria sp.]|uniref:DUF4386 domain-containing protein n=1 Tax=Frateuria sp. TaxID=2211372 RepID=UPI002DF5CADE|nr:DUF4386 domain-containing protein [Frateuria sp.]
MPTSEPANANRLARTAGLLYLVTVVTGMFYLGYVPSRFSVHADAAATVARILQSQALFRLGIAAELVCNAAFLLLPLALYRLLEGAGRKAAVLMVAFATASVPVACANVVHRFEVLSLLGDAGYLQAFTATQLHAQAMLQLDAYRHGLLVLEVFWGAWLLPFGYLVFKCGLLPRLLGALLVLGGLGYLVDFLGTLLLPSYPASAVAGCIMFPASLGEIGTCLWLLVVGARPLARLADTSPA